MDDYTVQTNLNTIKEMILDEQKLVTYISLSKELCIHVNDSKSLLSKIVEDIRSKQPDSNLNVKYLISGIDNDKARTTVTSEVELEALRKEYQKVFFEHIYSVSKGYASLDNVTFLALNNFEDFSLCTGIIKNNACIKRTSDEIGNLKSRSQVAVLPEQKPINPPQKKAKVESNDVLNNGHEKTNSISKIQETKSEPIIKEISSAKNDLTSSKPRPDFKKNGTKSQKGIAGFFNKSNSAPTKNEIKTIVNKKNEDFVEKTEKESVKPEVKIEKMDVDIKKNEKKEVKAENVNINSKNKTLDQIKKNAKVDKQRKRVLHVSDSESDDEKGDPFAKESAVNHESDDEIPPTPSVSTVKITSGIVNPKKRRKIVDKTYTDAEGYILTRKEEIYESGSENEEEIHAKENVQVQQLNVVKQEISPKKKNEAKTSKKKKASPQKGKQATLMNFFKKI